MTNNFDWALYWHSRGYNCVPQAPNFEKHPGIKWKNLQTRRVTEAELYRWQFVFERGVGFITGAISNTIVVETDGAEGEGLLKEFERLHGLLPRTLTIRSGSGRGRHLHFQHPGHRVVTRANPSIRIDVKGDGGFAILPPSLHRRGSRYEIIQNAPPAPLPKGLLDFIETKAARAKGSPSRPSTPQVIQGKAGDRPILDRLMRSFHPIAPAPPNSDPEEVAELIAHHWPRNGGRHAGALILGGVLHRGGYDADAIGEIVGRAAELGGDEEIADRVQAACSAATAYAAGGEVAGIPRLREAFGDECANQLIALLDYGGGLHSSQRADPLKNLSAPLCRRTTRSLRKLFARP